MNSIINKISKGQIRRFCSSKTIDPDGIKHFAKMSEGWWNLEGTLKPLHAMNQLRVPFIREGLISTGIVPVNNQFTPKPLQGLKIIDVGCGGGILTEPLAKCGAHVTGLDACTDLLNIAKSHLTLNPSLSNNLTYVNDTIENYCINNKNTYDAVVSSEVIEHCNNQELFLSSCLQVLKPGGSVFITTLNKTFLSWFLGIVVVENVVNIVPKGTHQWEKFVAPHDIERILEKHNCATKLVHGMVYNMISNKWHWCSSLQLNFALHAVKLE